MEPRPSRLALASILILVISGCVSSAPKPGFVVLETPRFGWRAAKGLGWGSRLAPVLARLDKLTDVVESRVDWSGRYILLQLREDALEIRAVRDAAVIMGEGSRRAGADMEADRLEGYRQGEPWMRAHETLRLSLEEARIIAERLGAQAAKEAGLSDAKARRLVAVIQEEAAAAFERVAKGEGVGEEAVLGRLRKELCAAKGRSLERGRAFLSQEEIDRVAIALPLD